MVGGDGIWNCHVHTDDIGAAIEAGIAVGRPRDIRVTDLLEQVADREEAAVGPRPDRVAAAALEHVTTAVVAVAVGDGLRTLLRGLGVQQVVAGGQSMNPSTAQILEAVDARLADGVIVLPNNKNIVPVAKQVPGAHRPPGGGGAHRGGGRGARRARRLRPRRVARRQPGRDGRGRRARARRRGHPGGARQRRRVRPDRDGDWIAITRDGIHVAVKSATDAAVALVDVLVDDDAELVTIIVGADADADDTARISEHLAERAPRRRGRGAPR